MKCARLTALAAALLVAGCAQTVQYQHMSSKALRNDQGHVIGHTDFLREARTGEQVEQVTYYTPLLDSKGEVVGYEEPVRGGTLIRAVDGRRIGARYAELRSRGTNPGNDGITVTFQPAQPRRD